MIGSFTLAGLLCFSKYGIETGKNDTFFDYEPLEPPFINQQISRFENEQPIISKSYILHDHIYLNHHPIFPSKGIRRYEAVSKSELFYLDEKLDLVHLKPGFKSIIVSNISLFTFDHVRKELYWIDGMNQLIVHPLTGQNQRKIEISDEIRDLEVTSGILLIYKKNYEIVFDQKVIASTKELAKIPFFAYKSSQSKFPVIYFVPILVVLLLIGIYLEVRRFLSF